MGDLAERLALFLWTVAPALTESRRLEDDLRWPHGYEGIFRGSDLGARLWAPPQGAELLDFVTQDPAYLETFGGHWDPRDEARQTLAGVVGVWQACHERPEDFAARIEAELWDSLRRDAIETIAVAVVPGVVVPDEGLPITDARYVLAPSEKFMGWAFAKAWPEYRLQLPARSYALFVAAHAERRRDGGGQSSVHLARIAIHLARDAIWLATGELPSIDHAVAWEKHAFPINPPLHYEPERVLEGIEAGAEVQLEQFLPELSALVPRLMMLERARAVLRTYDPATSGTLTLLHDKVSTAVNSPSVLVTLLEAFQAANGSLCDRHERENSDQVPPRFAMFCASDDNERRQLDKTLKALVPIRRALAHGDLPLNRDLERFLGGPVDSIDAPESDWAPPFYDPSIRAARRRAVEVLRRLYRAWLMATMTVENGYAAPALTRAQVHTLIHQARHRDTTAIAQLRALNNFSTAAPAVP